MYIPAWFWVVIAFLFGINIGSFLNVVIWRLPRGGSLIEPVYSYCPACRRRLTAIDLVPLFSFLLLGRRCRTCKQPISWRYFSVELLTGLLFVALVLRFPHSAPDAIAVILFTALLVPMTFIDLEFFTIPTSLNLLAFGVAVAWDVWGIVQREPAHALLWGWLPRSLLGGIAGILIFGFVRVAGWLWKRREAMGLGDVILARAMGAMLVQLAPAGLPILRLFPAWVLFSCLSGMIVGPALIFLRSRKAAAEKRGVGVRDRGSSGREAESEDGELEEDEEVSSLRQQLLDIGHCLWLGDLIEYVFSLFPGNRSAEPTIEEEGFEPDPTAIPFGPFLALGFLATVFAGELLTALYLAYAIPKPG